MKQRGREHDQVQNNNDRVLQETDKAGPGFRAMLEAKTPYISSRLNQTAGTAVPSRSM